MWRLSFSLVTKRCLLICFATLLTFNATGQEPAASGSPAKRPRVALVLAGGGAKVGWKSVGGGGGSRQQSPVEQRRFNDTSGSIELGLKGSKIVSPSGLI